MTGFSHIQFRYRRPTFFLINQFQISTAHKYPHFDILADKIIFPRFHIKA
ncbi:hypothetical protein HHE03_12900 [Helicobacter heilmannii]|nr:hypothetical protein HHE03_12900 [Helicobacter heilmannii]